MPEAITVEAYQFEELSDKLAADRPFGTPPREKARVLIAGWLSEDRNRDLQELFAEHLTEYGFPTDKIEWSLGCSQGDGMAFYGTVDVDAYCKRKGIMKRMRPLRAADPDVTIETTDYSNHYSHWNTMRVDVTYHGVETDKRDALMSELDEMMSEDVKAVSRELERQGYAHLEVTDEDIIAYCDDTERRFLVDGRLI